MPAAVSGKLRLSPARMRHDPEARLSPPHPRARDGGGARHRPHPRTRGSGRGGRARFGVDRRFADRQAAPRPADPAGGDRRADRSHRAGDGGAAADAQEPDPPRPPARDDRPDLARPVHPRRRHGARRAGDPRRVRGRGRPVREAHRAHAGGAPPLPRAVDRRAGRLGRALEARGGDAGARALHPGRAENLGRRRGAGGAQALRGQFRRLVPLGAGRRRRMGRELASAQGRCRAGRPRPGGDRGSGLCHGRDRRRFRGGGSRARFLSLALLQPAGGRRPARAIRVRRRPGGGGRLARRLRRGRGPPISASASPASDDARQMAELAELGKDFG